MDWTVAGVVLGIALGLALVVGVVVRLARQQEPTEGEPDPRFIAGIALVGSGTALIAAVGPIGLMLIVVGAVLMVTSMRGRPGH